MSRSIWFTCSSNFIGCASEELIWNIFKCAKNTHRIITSWDACMIIARASVRTYRAFAYLYTYLHDVIVSVSVLFCFSSFFFLRLLFPILKSCGCEIFNSWPQKKSRTQKVEKKTHISRGAHRTLNKQSMKINFANWLPSAFSQALNQVGYDVNNCEREQNEEIEKGKKSHHKISIAFRCAFIRSFIRIVSNDLVFSCLKCTKFCTQRWWWWCAWKSKYCIIFCAFFFGEIWY